MQMEKKTSIAGAFAKKHNYEYEGKEYQADIQDGDAVTIVSAGETVQGNYGEQHVFQINTRNGVKNLSFNQTTTNNLIDAFGSESEDWVNKEVKVFMIKAMVSGKLQGVVYLAAVGWEMDNEGNFSPGGDEVAF